MEITLANVDMTLCPMCPTSYMDPFWPKSSADVLGALVSGFSLGRAAGAAGHEDKFRTWCPVQLVNGAAVLEEELSPWCPVQLTKGAGGIVTAF